MAIVGAFDVHRAQLTFDYISTETGEVRLGQIRPADRRRLRAWLTRLEGVKEVVFAVEACIGWRYVVEELERAGCEVHLAEPADLSRERGPKKRPRPMPPTPVTCVPCVAMAGPRHGIGTGPESPTTWGRSDP